MSRSQVMKAIQEDLDLLDQEGEQEIYGGGRRRSSYGGANIPMYGTGVVSSPSRYGGARIGGAYSGGFKTNPPLSAQEKAERDDVLEDLATAAIRDLPKGAKVGQYKLDMLRADQARISPRVFASVEQSIVNGMNISRNPEAKQKAKDAKEISSALFKQYKLLNPELYPPKVRASSSTGARRQRRIVQIPGRLPGAAMGNGFY